MNFREFIRFHLIKALLVLVAIQIGIVAIVQNFNHRPEANTDMASLIEGKNAKVSPLLNDSDKDEKDELSLSKVSEPLHGKLEQKANTITYTPNKGYIGGDSVTYSISDGRKESKEAKIVFYVNKNNKATVNSDSFMAFCKEKIALDVLRNDQDPEGDSVYIDGYSLPKNGNLVLAGGQFIYTAGTSAIEDSFKYCISDGINNSDSVKVKISVKPANSPNYPWTSCDVGNAAIAGSTIMKDGKIIMEGSGTDIWDEVDGFQFAYQLVHGDCEIVTRVESLKGSHEWAKAGIMVRETLFGDSKVAFNCVSNRNGTGCQQRKLKGEYMEGGNRTIEAQAPYWIKLVRSGDKFSYYDSKDGHEWHLLQDAEVQMNKKVYVGFALTSHNNSELAKAAYNNYSLKGKIVKLN